MAQRRQVISKEVRIDLRSEDRFIVYTDGVVEAMDEQHNMYGFRRLAKKFLEFASKDCDNFLNSLLTELREFRGAAPPHDDLTIVTVRHMPKKNDEGTQFFYVSGQRFVKCRFCETVNARESRRCKKRVATRQLLCDQCAS